MLSLTAPVLPSGRWPAISSRPPPSPGVPLTFGFRLQQKWVPFMMGTEPGTLRTTDRLGAATSSWGTWAVVAAARPPRNPARMSPLRCTQPGALTCELSRGASEATQLAIAVDGLLEGGQVTVTVQSFMAQHWGPRPRVTALQAAVVLVLCPPLLNAPKCLTSV